MLRPKRVVDPDHRNLDQVGRGTLERGILGLALTEGADVEVLVPNLGNVAPPLEEGLDVAALLGQRHLLVQERAHAGKPLEVGGDERLGFLLTDAELARERKRTLSVDRSEIDGLGAGAHLTTHLARVDAEDQRCRLAVDVLAGLEGRHEGRVTREVRHEAQLDLGIVRHHEAPARAGDEPAADRLATRRADRDVLQVRIGGREPPRGRTRLVEAGVDSSGGVVDLARQHFDIGGPQLLQLAILQQQSRHLVPLVGQLLQDVRVGGGAGLGLLEDRQAQLLEQHHSELLRGVQVERLIGGAVDLALQPVEITVQLLRQPREERPVNPDPGPLHVHQDFHQRHLDLAKQVVQLHLGKLRVQQLTQRQHGGAVGAAVGRGARHRHLGERHLGLALSRHVTVALHWPAEQFQAQVVDAVGAPPRIGQETGQHAVVNHAGQFHPGAAQHLPVVLEVVSRLADGGVGEERHQWRTGRIGNRRQIGDGVGRGQFAGRRPVTERQVPDLGGRCRQRQPDQLGVVGLERRGLGVQRHQGGGAQPLHQGG